MPEAVADPVVTPAETALEPSTLAEIVQPEAIESPPSGPQIESAADSAEQRQEWVRRIRAEQRLPGALRDRLAKAVEDLPLNASGEPQLSVSQVASVFAEAVPSLMALDAPRTLAPHPAGEAFFQGGQLSDDDAARIAREQLARTGFSK
jgi:hypothetical protein